MKTENDTRLFNTVDFEAVLKLCDTAREHHLMIGLTGDTGTGKTTATREYAKRDGVTRVSYEKSMNPRLFFVMLLREMGVDHEGNIHDMINKVADTLNEIQAPLLIIDEAGKMPHAMILHLHDLREKIKDHAGIVLAGMPYFKTNLQKFASKGKEGCSEFFRRVNLWHTLEGLSAGEARAICQASGIKDPERLRELSRKRRFGDLVNEIVLEEILSGKL